MNSSDYQDIVSIIENTRQRGNSKMLAHLAFAEDGLLVAPTHHIAEYIGGTPVYSSRLSARGKKGPIFFDNSTVYDMAKEILRLQSLDNENKALKKEVSRLEDKVNELENEIDDLYRK